MRSFIVLLIALNAQAELIPAARLFNWQANINVGVTGGIPTDRTNIINVTSAPYSADNTGAADASVAIQAAIGAAVSGDVVFLPAGTYRLDAGLSLNYTRAGITLRGAGATTILLPPPAGAYGIFVNGSGTDWPYDWESSGITITSGYTQGSTSLTMSDASSFSNGQTITVSEQNDYTLPAVNPGGHARVRAQKVKVTNKAGNVLTISPPLAWTLGAARVPKASPMLIAVTGVGIEDLKIDCTGTTAGFAIEFDQTIESWVKNVTVREFSNYGIAIFSALNVEVRRCDIRDRKAGGSNGASILIERSSSFLVEDNILYNCFPLLEVNFGSSAGVFAYNFTDKSDIANVIGVSIDPNHGAHPHFNLYEGNTGPRFQADGFFGSCSDDTVFRNWFHGTSPDLVAPDFGQFCVQLMRFTRNYNVVGNILGKLGTVYNYQHPGATNAYHYVLGYPNIGNLSFSGHAPPWSDPFAPTWPGSGGFQELDDDVEATLIRKGNAGTLDGVSYATPAGEALGGDTMPTSYFRSSKPEWFGDRAWPPFNSLAPGTPDATNIPAGYRYVNGVDPPSGTARKLLRLVPP